MKKYLSISALMAGALALGGCNNNEPSAGGNDAQAQGSINFSVGQESPGSRTQYSPSDWLQIEWIKDVDDISIFCAQTQKTLT